MCGIAGIIGKNEHDDIHNIIESIKHRGPDDEGTYKDPNIELGFRRLSIIDLSKRGHQPMSNESSTVWIVFNGEIYNYLEIKKQLLSKHKFISDTDTEVLIHGYEEWGIENLLKKVNGMFAFCIYDKVKKTSYLVRDRVGKKPIYYFKGQEYIAFASESKALFKLHDFRFSINKKNFINWLGFSYLPDNKNTIIDNVYKVAPGSYLEISTKDLSVKKHQYWTLPQKQITIELDDAVKELESLLVDSVKRRLAADVPVAILLSGGLDSSLITALASQHADKQIQTITISFKNSGINESEFAHMVSKHCHTKHIDLQLDVKNVYSEFKNNIWIFDDLTTVDGGLLSTYLLSKQIRNTGVKVVLVGEGADEVFGGYSWFQLSQYPFRVLPDSLKANLYYYAIMRIFRHGKFRSYPSFLKSKLNETYGSYFKKIQAYEINYSLPNHYCMKLDKGTSAASIEARAPFLDYRVIEYARSLPDNYILRSNWCNPRSPNEKFILRKIAEKYLPQNICRRKKRGGMLPINDVLNHGLLQDKGLILNNDLLINFFGKQYLANLIDNKPINKILEWQREWILWKCLTFALWENYYGQYGKN